MIVDIQEIKARVSIEDILVEQGITLKKGRCRCPLHNGHNPTSLSVKDGRFYCFSCGATGDVITLIRLLHGYDFKRALEFLCKKVGIEFNSTTNEWNKSDHLPRLPTSYYEKRLLNLQEETVRAAEKFWIVYRRKLDQELKEQKIRLVDYYTRLVKIEQGFAVVDECYILVQAKKMKLKNDIRERAVLPRD